MGIENCFVSSNTIDELQTSFQAYFDKVILDAPCSGSGMFRKSDEMREDWKYEKVCRLQSLQKELILKSYRLVKQGGYLLYSTCSFSPEENEQVVQYLLDNTLASLVTIPASPLLQRGLNMPEAVRLYPHTFPGEGQFIAWIQSHDEYPSYHKRQKINASTISLEPFWQFVQRYLNRSFDPKRLYINNNHLHYLPVDYPQLPKLALLRSGLHLGQFIKGRFEPSHALALASTIEDWKQVYLVSLDSKEVQAFLKGESFAISQPLEGYVLVCCESVPLGYAKITQGILKNHYPKGLRNK
jgi:NOL1/NOP2/fmu family ribosome biogenesis protein